VAPRILPLPRKLTTRPGVLDLSGDVPLYLSPLAEDREFVCAYWFQSEAAERGGAELPIEKSWRPDVDVRCVRFMLFGRDDTIAPELRKLPHPKELGEEGYVIDVTARRALVAANGPKGLFYAAQTLKQLLEVRRGKAVLSCCRIVDWPDFKYRGVMLDVSRFRVPRVEFLLELIDMLATLKINVLQLYTEHPFAWRKHPLIGKGISPLTAEELLLLGHRCRAVGIELQGNLQSFGHHRHLLTRKGYDKYAEVPGGYPLEIDAATLKRYPWLNAKRLENWSLSPAVPASYKLLGELYDEVLPLFDSELFNASCDETWDLGYGRSKKSCLKRGKAQVYLEHIRKLHKLVRARGKRMMMWGDIVLDHPEVIKQLPKDTLVLNWGYNAQKNWNPSCRAFAKAGLEFWVCPGVNSWGTIFPQTELARANIRKFAMAGKRHGATGLLNTDWGDDGHAQPPTGSFHGYAYGAEQSWNCGKRGDADFDRRFSWAVFRDASGRFGNMYAQLGRTGAPFGKDRPLDYGHYPFHFLWDRFEFPRPRQVRGKWANVTESQLATAEKHARAGLALARELRADKTFAEERHLLDECVFAAEMTLSACRRQRIFDPACAALGGEKQLTKRQRKEIVALRAEWRRFRKRFEDLWEVNSRRSQISYRLGLFRKGEKDYTKVLAKR
jgi:hexosaminidase